MILWLDAHISPILAVWIHDTFGVEVLHVRNLDLRQAEDREIFERARAADAILLTKVAGRVNSGHGLRGISSLCPHLRSAFGFLRREDAALIRGKRDQGTTSKGRV